ncbi:MAG: hypothetical protein V4510_11705 [bacterium]
MTRLGKQIAVRPVTAAFVGGGLLVVASILAGFALGHGREAKPAPLDPLWTWSKDPCDPTPATGINHDAPIVWALRGNATRALSAVPDAVGDSLVSAPHAGSDGTWHARTMHGLVNATATPRDGWAIEYWNPNLQMRADDVTAVAHRLGAATLDAHLTVDTGPWGHQRLGGSIGVGIFVLGDGKTLQLSRLRTADPRPTIDVQEADRTIDAYLACRLGSAHASQVYYPDDRVISNPPRETGIGDTGTVYGIAGLAGHGSMYIYIDAVTGAVALAQTIG